MTSRKDQQRRRREERLAAQGEAEAAARRRLVAGYFVAAILGVALLVGVIVAITSGGSEESGGEHVPPAAHIDPLSGEIDEVRGDGREGTSPPPVKTGELAAAAKQAGCELQLNLPDEGNNHFTDEDTEVSYGTDPSTSGDHYGVPTETLAGAQADGAYAETPEVSRTVHSLEHGRIEIQYSSSLPPKDQLALKGVFDEDPDKVLLFPNDQMPYEVGTTAWTQLMGCRKYDGAATLDAVRDFRDAYRDQGPESF